MTREHLSDDSDFQFKYLNHAMSDKFGPHEFPQDSIKVVAVDANQLGPEG